MAVFNEILVGRFARSVQKLFGVKAQPPVNALSSDVMCTHHYFSGAENRYLEGWNLFAHSFRNSGGATSNVMFQFRNPVGSNVIAVFTSLVIATYSAADEVFVSHGPQVADLITTSLPTNDRLDSRGSLNPVITLTFAANGNVPPGDLQTLYNFNLPNQGTNSFIFYDAQEIPLLPGEAIRIRNAVNNVLFSSGMFWRERFLEDSERT